MGLILFQQTHKAMNQRKLIVLVTLQQALLGEVSDRLRAVTVSYDEKSIHFDCYYDGEVMDEDCEAMSYVETELIAAFPDTHEITHKVHRKDFPESIPKDNAWAFYRKEQCD